MQTSIHLSLSLSTALLLTACGGGGGGDNNPPLDPGTPPANIPGNNAGNSVNGIYRGTAVVVPSGSTINSSHRTLNIGSDYLTQYVGQAAFVRNGDAGTGDTRFTADFAAKTLNGTITSKSSSVTFTPVNINATINGNSFATANGAAVSSGGHFYGDNARELGGLFSDTVQRLSGSFGAIRQ